MRDVALQLLQKALANPAADFRAGQWECIEGILKRQRQLVVQKTGWGKSMVYFLEVSGGQMRTDLVLIGWVACPVVPRLLASDGWSG